MASDTDDLSRLIVELTGIIDRNDRAILKELGEIRLQLSDIQERVEANIREGPPDEDEDES